MSKTKFEVDRENLEVRLTRVFNASPERLWQAFSDPEQIPHWWGMGKLVVDKQEFKVGGRWRYVEKDQDGKEHAFKGEFMEIEQPHKITRTFEYEPVPGHVLLESITFDSQPDGQTKASFVSSYKNLDDLNGMVSMGMEKGATMGLDRLAKLVEK
jgi:uncharacterized protein YndB with AHSA1/START domain